jgi:filamentous hemagglutinin family protein
MRHAFGDRFILVGLSVATLLTAEINARADGSLRGAAMSGSNHSGSTGTGTTTSQTSTAATTATSQAAQTATITQNAQVSLQRSVQALLAMQKAQQAAQSAARNLALPAVPNGLTAHGLVPDSGLASDGVANAVTTWRNANTPTQTTTTANGQTTTTVNVQQTGQQALLSWHDFNIGQNTTLNFDQSAGGANVGSWIAFNKVAPSIAPSEILGSITAQGQVYVLNQNGIIFGGTSQVNVHALVASSLPINDNLSNPTTGRGLLNNPDLQFLFSQQNIPAGTLGPTPAFTPTPAPTGGMVAHLDSAGNLTRISASGHDGDVVVQAGANLSSPATAEHVGGKIALVGPNVENAGTISTSDGQTILAAGLQVGFVAHPSNSSNPSNPAYGTSGPSLRGLDTYVGAVDSSSGTVFNTGLVDSPRADITMVGKTVDQFGVINTSTSVALNGRIDLLADYEAAPIFPTNGQSPNYYPTLTGTVNLGSGSLTQILPELSSTDTVIGTTLALGSQVNIQGKMIDLAANSTLLAPSATVTLNAGDWLKSNPGYTFANSSGQIELDSGAIIDVSGMQAVSASVKENIVTAQLLGTELANSPLQQNGPLRGQTVQIDTHQLVSYNGQTYVGTALANLSGYVNLIQHSVGELSTNGGTVTLSAGKSVVLQDGSEINVSGGWINYQGGLVETTRVILGGQVLDISQATPDRIYEGIYKGSTTISTKWGTSQNFTNPLLAGTSYEQGYTQGGNGGSLTITAPAMTLTGNLYGNTVAGVFQRAPSSITTQAGVQAWRTLPTAGALSLNFSQASTTFGQPNFSPAPPDIVFQPGSGPKVADPFAALGNPELDLSADLVNLDGFGNLSITNNNNHFVSGNSGAIAGAGGIAIPVGVSLTTQPGSKITFDAGNIDIEGKIIAQGGSLNFTTENTSPLVLSNPTLVAPPAIDPTRGQLTLGSQALLDVSGLITDDRSGSLTANSLPQVDNGGNVTINSFSANLATGSRINVSGGVDVSATGATSYGAGGNITVNAGLDPNVGKSGVSGGHLILGSELDGYSGGKGGSLTILAPLIQIGGSTLMNGDSLATGQTLWIDRTDAGGNLLGPDFFDQGGFSSFMLNGIGTNAPGQTNPLPALWIASNARISPEAESLQVTLGAGGVGLQQVQMPLGLRAPVSLSFGANGVTNPFPPRFPLVRGDLVMDAGANIALDPNSNSSVNFIGNTVTLLGDVTVPGGTITVSGGKSSNSIFGNVGSQNVLATVDLGPTSKLSTAGATLLTPNAFGYRTGSVLNGGTISVVGNIVAEPGAILDVSGSSGILDMSPAASGTTAAGSLSQSSLVTTRVDSNGGSITLKGSEELYADATLLGYAGGITAQGGNSSAQGGSLTLSSGVFLPVNVSLASLSALDQVVDQTGLLVVTPNAANFPLSGRVVIGTAVSTPSAPLPDTTAFSGYGHFAANNFNQSGLDSLTLNGSVLFSGTAATPLTLKSNGSLTIGNGGVILVDDQGTHTGIAINLNASYVDLGMGFMGPLNSNGLTSVYKSAQSSSTPLYLSPTWGASSLNVAANNLIDVGNLSLQNIGTVNLTAGNSITQGDIRGNGTLDVAGKIALAAGQIYPTTESIFNIVAYADPHAVDSGSVIINSTGPLPELPLSAGGTLNIYAANITQDGVLRAPIGAINLGWDGKGLSPIDFLSGAGTGQAHTPATVNVTQQLTLGAGGTTSVSAIDSTFGPLTLPYGTVANGVSWIDPSGLDITAGGVPGKTISISAVNVSGQANSTIDISGGGDLYAYNWVTGVGGTNDILNSTTNFAILPNDKASYAPYYSSSDYTNGKLAIGERVYLNASNGLPAGFYTLLPARYALLPGAFLVTPQSGAGTSFASAKPDGSSIVLGYQSNALNSTATRAPAFTSFEVASQSVVRARAQYDNYDANSWLKQSALANNALVPRLPVDAGHVVLTAISNMNIDGRLSSLPGTGGLGGLVDISSPNEIDIVSGAGTTTAGILTLSADTLQNFSAASLLIGGSREVTGDETAVTVTTNNLQVENDVALTGSDIILTSNGLLKIADGVNIELISSSIETAPTLAFGNANSMGSGDGVLVRVSNDPFAQIVRSGVDTQVKQETLAVSPSLSIGANVRLGGITNPDGSLTSAGSVTLDSTDRTSLDSSVSLGGSDIAINSGQISLVLDGSQPSTGLVLSGATIAALQSSAQALSLLSYSSISIYESGIGAIGTAADASGNYQVQSLALHANEIQGFGGGAVTINAKNFILDNSPGGTPSALGAAPLNGTLIVNTDTIRLGGGTGTNGLDLDGYANVSLNASNGILMRSAASTTAMDGTVTHGASSLTTAGALNLTTPRLTGVTAAHQTITAQGNLTINAPAGASTSTMTGGLGASLTLVGSSIIEGSAIDLPSGNLKLEATAGNVIVESTGTLDVGGITQTFNDLIKYTSGGHVTLTSDKGNVILTAGSIVDVAAQSAAGNAGDLAVNAQKGAFIFNGSTLQGQGGANGQGGAFSLDAGSIPGGSLQPLDSALYSSGFIQSISIRDRTDSNVLVDGLAKVATYNLSVDQGSITVNGTIDASNVAATDPAGKPILVGGAIDLAAGGSIILNDNSLLTVAGQQLNNNGKGGSVTLEAGSYEGSQAPISSSAIVLGANSKINLSINGGAGGTVHLRAPQVSGGAYVAGDTYTPVAVNAANGGTPTDVAIAPIANGVIKNASDIVVEGFFVQDANSTATASIDGFQAKAKTNATTFMNNWQAIQTRLFGAGSLSATAINIQPGEEIDNSKGGLVLNNDWDLSTWRFGAKQQLEAVASGSYADSIYFNGGQQISVGVEPGILTMRATGSITFNGSLTDGFGDSAGDIPIDSNTGNASPWLNTLLPTFQNRTGQQSWSYRLTAGADLSAAAYQQVAGNTGSIKLGKLSSTGQYIANPSGPGALTANAIIDPQTGISYYQVIRTGTGDITISAANNVDLLNQFATIYTAGTQAPTISNFDTPLLFSDADLGQLGIGGLYPAQYSQNGGNVTIMAQGNIEHLTRNLGGNLIADSERELPTSWLYRRGAVDVIGNFAPTVFGDIASTSWWVDFSNFFEGVGALGGGNVTMTAGQNIDNVDAVVPTNARMSNQTATGDRLAVGQTLVELGGGNLVVHAGNDINAGVYYVERGQGTLNAGYQIISNATRSPSLSTLGISGGAIQSQYAWLPTTLFLGQGNFDVTAGSNLLLGPVANPFLLPQGIGNSYWDKTYFSTYAGTDAVNVASLTGSVTLRDSATLTTTGNSASLSVLQAWYANVLLLPLASANTAAYYQPWLNLAETNVAQFATLATILPDTLKVTAFSGDINVVGTLNLTPAAQGTIDLLASDSVNAFQPDGTTINQKTGKEQVVWASGMINLSDADPTVIPGIGSPYAYQSQTNVGINSSVLPVSDFLDLSPINNLFNVSGSTTGIHGILQTKQQLHTSGLLHLNDRPLDIYAQKGNISGLTLFSSTAARLMAGQDITDIALYIQNDNAGDISLVAAGRYIIAYDPTSVLRQEVNLATSIYSGYNTSFAPLGSGSGSPNAGDIQIAGPGTLEVLAGRNLNLGVGANNLDGTAVGITSIGKTANPYLPFKGANVVAGAGIGAPGFDASQMNFGNFIVQFLTPGTAESAIYLPELGTSMGLPSTSSSQEIWTAFNQLSSAHQDALALDIFYLVLRNAGRDHNNPTSPNAGSYADGNAAIKALFGDTAWSSSGDISLTSREIKTTNGGDITLLAPGGQLNVGLNLTSAQAADQGILTVDGGNINIFANGNVNVGTSRIFTLHGGNEIIWSTTGNIAAGNSSKTVQSAPPTRVLIDPQSANVQTDLAGLATGGGIGVLETVVGAPPANVDLVAPNGIVNAGDAGIRASGNLNIAAVQVLNAGNISVGGKSSGVPTTTAPNIGGLSAASNTAGAASNTASEAARQAASRAAAQQDQMLPSIITVEVIGYGGGDDSGV